MVAFLESGYIMILVTLGTQDKPFTRVLRMVEDCIDSGLINESVIVQAGHTKYNSDKMKIIDFLDPKTMDNYINESSYLITHGGVGSIFSGLNCHKKIIAIARLKKYGEHENDHQLQIINEFEKDGFLINGTNDLSSAIKKLKQFNPHTYQSNQNNFIKLISDYIESN